MKQRRRYISPLQSFDVHLQNYQNLIRDLRKKKDVEHVLQIVNDCLTTSSLSHFLSDEYDALVLTNTSQNILWVSEGFTHMTGYSKKYALGKTPVFLQGKETSVEVRNQIREELKSKHSFTGNILNYRKNGEKYLCNITILPIYNKKENLKYFLALEKEERMSA